MRVPRSYDVFCRVVDNFGDAAVCWRLARGLAAPGAKVRLWIDDPQALRTLLPGLGDLHEGVEVRAWRAESEFGEPADVAVDAFGCGLPESYARAMAGTGKLWIVLEYLSAEPWVASHHGLPSPHPSLDVARYFFFPGFVPGTGGLIREAGLGERREAFLRASPPHGDALTVTLFGYENAALSDLLEGWSAGPSPVVALVPESRISGTVAAFFEVEAPPAGTSLERGSLEARFLPFVPQDRYDELLWGADWNFVRGEDSFVRAQWAERPMVWQPYVQPGDAHLVKLEAFLERYCEGLEAGLEQGVRELMRGWNGVAGADAAAGWRALSSRGDTLRAHARDWAARAAQPGDLAINLARFCSERLE